MSRIRQYQSNFTIGEIDPLLRGRVDIEQYYSCLLYTSDAADE